MKEKTPYDVLGVEATATPSEIKKARRKKAAAAHPDTGGSHAEMAAINHAFDILINPERRQHYDATGEDKRVTTLQDEAQNMILFAFQTALQEESHNPLACARSFVADNRARAEQQQQELTQRRAHVEAQRPRVSVQSGKNLFHSLIDQQVQALDRSLASFARGIQVCDLAAQLLEHYATTAPEPEPSTANGFTTIRFY